MWLLSVWLLTSFSQVDLLAHHGGHSTTASDCYSVLSSRGGVLPPVVRFLVICRPSHHSVAILRLPTCHPSTGSHQAYQASPRRSICAKGGCCHALLQGRAR